MNLNQETHNKVDECTRKTRAVMDQLRSALNAETDPAIRDEIQDEISCVAMSWQFRQMLNDDAD